MSWTILSNKKVKVRKPRVCHGCNTEYDIGTKMNRNVSVDSGDISTSYWCGICEEFLADKWKNIDDEGIGQGDCWEYSEYEAFREQKQAKNE